ncbi:MAG: aldehyde dehydrogenase family protein [Aigarchaeota archaeon]|nr:aldehyde dehydrogenase family protein [Aigarchaeota archaeon]MDW8092064.1 aldehyde dehydrogenase family protein [Nitrososphaerota archaeon]
MVIEVKNIIGGEFTAGNGTGQERRNPANGELVSRYNESSMSDVNSAVESARVAFEESAWPVDGKLRARVMRAIHSIVVKELDYFATVQSMENGKVLRDSKVEVNTAADLFDYYSGLCRLVSGRTVSPDPNVMSFVVREPVGVVSIIVPWNAPIVLLARSLAPALAAGNSVIVKPSSLTPGTVYEFLRRIVEEVKELPRGLINMVIGGGDTVGRELVRHPEVDMVSFTGSTEAGAQVMRDASTTIKRLSLELGGKTPNIILEDADFNGAIEGAIKGAMLGSAGQICFAGTRVLVEEDIYKRFKESILERFRRLKVGNPLTPGVDVGPLVSMSQLERVAKYVEEGQREAELLVGGMRLTGDEYSTGYFMEPTVFTDVPVDAKIAQEEIFGPVVSVIPFKTVEEAAEVANRTKYGLSAAIWTRDLNKALRLARSVKAGVVWVNMYGRMFSEAESGGYKQSGLGRLRGIEGLHSFTEVKDILINLST